MQQSRSHVAGDSFRRRVLGVAFTIGVALALAPHTTSVRADDLGSTVLAQADAPAMPGAPAAAPTPDAPPPAAAPNASAPPAAAPERNGANADADEADAAEDTDAHSAEDKPSPKARKGSHSGIVIEKGNKRIRVEGLGRDHEYDSFEQFVQDAPWLAGLVFLATLLVFLIPLLIVVLLIWYKLRKNRIAHETMLKLAERGVVPAPAAIEAVASGTTSAVAAAATTPAPGTPAYDQARYLHRRTVWSDLRKGVILVAVGLGLSFWSMLDDGTPNSVGLILLFVGLGYCLLWFFEDRATASPRTPGTPPGSR